MKRISSAGNPLNNQRGIALILAILLLMVITLFGALGITMSTREIRGAGTKRLDDQLLYGAQAGVAETLLANKGWLDDKFLTDPPATAQGQKNVADPFSAKPMAEVIIFCIQDDDLALAAERKLPVQPHRGPAEGYDLSYKARRFAVTATSTSADGRATTIREGVWRVFSK